MRGNGVGSFTLVWLCLGIAGVPGAEAFTLLASNINAASGATPVLMMGADRRLGAKEFAALHKGSLQDLQASHAASGLVECGTAHGAGQLTLSSDVVTTAAHVLFDERGVLRSKACNFAVELDGAWKRIPIDTASIVAGSVRPYMHKAARDWAVVKLTRPLDGVQPYDLADSIRREASVEFVARGHSNWRDAHDLSFEACQLRAETNQSEGVREFAFDCSTGDGSSGGAVLFDGVKRRLGAILVGWRSKHPGRPSPYSPAHYNFVVSVEGSFRSAVLRAAGKTSAPPTDAAIAARGSPADDGAVEEKNSRRSAAQH